TRKSLRRICLSARPSARFLYSYRLLNHYRLIKLNQVFHVPSDLVRSGIVSPYRVLPPVHLVHDPAGSAVSHVDAGSEGKGHIVLSCGFIRLSPHRCMSPLWWL